MNNTSLYFAFGRPFSPIYSLVMRLRETCYHRRILQSHRFDVPVISVGNLTLGGTGKTPMVQYLARLLQGQGFQPAIVSRGYGGSAQGKVNVVSDGSDLLLDAHAAGDEPRLLAETLPGVPVLTGIVRRLPAKQAVQMGADVLLLDDGFQHLQIVRDINLVLFSADHLAGNSRVFPGGDLREPVAALRRATGFIMTGVHAANRNRAQRFADLLQSKFPNIPVTFAGYNMLELVEISQDGVITPAPTEAVGSGKFFAFCGIAHPQSFFQTLVDRGISSEGFLSFADHQNYSKATVGRLLAEARRSNANCLLTTEKDLVKLARWSGEIPLPLYGIRMQVEAEPSFAEGIVKAVRLWRKPD